MKRAQRLQSPHLMRMALASLRAQCGNDERAQFFHAGQDLLTRAVPSTARAIERDTFCSANGPSANEPSVRAIRAAVLHGEYSLAATNTDRVAPRTATSRGDCASP